VCGWLVGGGGWGGGGRVCLVWWGVSGGGGGCWLGWVVVFVGFGLGGGGGGGGGGTHLESIIGKRGQKARSFVSESAQHANAERGGKTASATRKPANEGTRTTKRNLGQKFLSIP